MLAVLFLNRARMKRRVSVKKKCDKTNDTDSELFETLSDSSAEYCRTCMNTDDLVAIFCRKDVEEERTKELRLVTGLEIKLNDGLSQKICIQCIELLNSALQFRRTSRKVEKSLRNMAYGTVKTAKKKQAKLQKSLKSPKLEKASPKLEDPSPEKDYGEYAFDYDVYGGADDFQDDYDYDNKEEIIPKVKQKATLGKRKRMILPHSDSYKCNTCNKEFRMKATYKAHMRFHTNYCICESCGKRCRNNNQLQEHKRARHGLGRIHKCAYCEYSSATREALTIHERRHTGERPYICDHCGATFHRRSNLVQHMPIHLPEKNFQCDMCPKRLKSRKFLQIHKHNAHTGRRYGYLCPVCKHRFEKPNKVRAHSRRVHGLSDDQQGAIVRVQL